VVGGVADLLRVFRVVAGRVLALGVVLPGDMSLIVRPEVARRSIDAMGEQRRQPLAGGQTTGDRLRQVRHEVVACRACPRLTGWCAEVSAHPRASYADQVYWGRPVPGFGDPAARLAVVGLAPAAHGANRTGRMFTGDRSGDWLFGALFRAGYANQPTSVRADDGLVLHGAYVTAAVRCAPPANKPHPDERDRCLPYLRRELGALEGVRVVVVLGKFACDAVAVLYRMRPRPHFAHLAEAALPDGRVLLCSYHPSQQNTFTGTLTEEMFDAVFSRARALGA
jgi:uracil-DNA glycosylase family 4